MIITINSSIIYYPKSIINEINQSSYHYHLPITSLKLIYQITTLSTNKAGNYTKIYIHPPSY